MSCHLSAKLASDRTASACHKDNLACHVAHDLVKLHPDRLAAEQVLDLYLAELGYAYLALDHLV